MRAFKGVAFAAILAATGIAGAAEPKRDANHAAQVQKARDLNESVLNLYRPGRFAEALVPPEQALAIYEKALGPDDPEVGRCLFFLASLNYYQRRYAVAAPLFQRALANRPRE